ncbi:MAG: site-specific DNA-methyltransferase [Deltaproteobacteria bacterium CG11_big_fil_rev_8_21_14_0_20_49_13]|nr:MAG: site-specific DNA-methyltransferase [Deltaproteobacteria bacterium CG11_big_fil_rev_8_21_14_0_20_49_13]
MQKRRSIPQKVKTKSPSSGSLLTRDDYTDKIICGDCIEVMGKMPDKSIDLVVTSPPYNLKNSTGNGMKDGRGGKWQNAALINGYSHHDDCMPHEEYVAWQRSCLSEMMRLVKDDGAIFYNHKWRVQAGLLQDRHDIIQGFPVRQIIIWRRKGGINFNPGYFLPTYEVIYLIAKSKFRLAPKSNSFGDVWEFTQGINTIHPAPFPVTLIERVISSTKAKIILDPFMGSGTTAIAAINFNRHYAGIDVSPGYCKLAQERIVSHMKNSTQNIMNYRARTRGPELKQMNLIA